MKHIQIKFQVSATLNVKEMISCVQAQAWLKFKLFNSHCTQSYPTGSWGSGIKHGFSIQSLEPPETQEVASAASLYTSEDSPREAGQGRPTWGQWLQSQASHVHGRHGGQPSAFQNPSRVAPAWVRFWAGGRAEEGRAAGTPPPCHRPRHGQVH